MLLLQVPLFFFFLLSSLQCYSQTTLHGSNYFFFSIIAVFAYGATGAGKTHTMLGSQNDPGVMYRTMTELFKRMDDAKEEKEFAVAFSYLEVNI